MFPSLDFGLHLLWSTGHQHNKSSRGVKRACLAGLAPLHSHRLSGGECAAGSCCPFQLRIRNRQAWWRMELSQYWRSQPSPPCSSEHSHGGQRSQLRSASPQSMLRPTSTRINAHCCLPHSSLSNLGAALLWQSLTDKGAQEAGLGKKQQGVYFHSKGLLTMAQRHRELPATTGG